MLTERQIRSWQSSEERRLPSVGDEGQTRCLARSNTSPCWLLSDADTEPRSQKALASISRERVQPVRKMPPHRRQPQSRRQGWHDGLLSPKRFVSWPCMILPSPISIGHSSPKALW